MEITEDTGRALHEAIRQWLTQFDDPEISIVDEVRDGNPVVWEIRIEPRNPRCSKASVVWMGDPAQVYLGQYIWMDNLEDDPELVLPLLDAAANGRVTENIWGPWGPGPTPQCSEAELVVEGRVVKVSYGNLNPWERKRPPDATHAYEPWPRKPTEPSAVR
jgi:hypothetical protein